MTPVRAGRAGFVFHLPGSTLRDPGQMKPFYRRLIEGLQARDHPVALITHDRALVPEQVAGDAAFHIVDHGAHRHPRLLNAGIAYVYPFWHLDPWGIRALSSIGAKPFDAASITPASARRFADRLRARLVVPRKSRYPQPEAVTEIPAGGIAVFLQVEAHRGLGETCHLTSRQMVRGLIARDDPRPIVIKPHPLDQDPATRRFLARMAQDPRVTVTGANIHDILSCAAVAATINSAVGLEAMLHGVPVVLCGQADFHHAAVTVTTPAALSPAIAMAEATAWPHDAYVTWYFDRQCLNAGKPSLVDDFLARITLQV